VNHAEFSPDGRLAMTSSDDGSARVWDVQTGHSVSDPLRHEGRVNWAEFSRDGRWIATASDDNSAMIWEVPEVRLPIPGWLPNLAEAVAGKRLTLADESETVSSMEVLDLRKALSAVTSSYYARCANWLFAESASRSTSVSSQMNTSQADRSVDTLGMYDRGVDYEATRRLVAAVPQLGEMTDNIILGCWRIARRAAEGDPEAELLLQRTVEVMLCEMPGPSPTLKTQRGLVRALLDNGRYAEAEPLLLQRYEGLKQQDMERPDPANSKLIKKVAERIIDLYQAWGKAEQAESWSTKLAPWVALEQSTRTGD
jgi:hypothetical protein